MEVPFLDLKAQNKAVMKEVLPLWEEIIESAGFIGGKYVSAFEDEFAKACSARYCATVNSGTDALRFIFMALGVRAGDEIITVPNTFIATTEAISQAGGKIVYVDVDPDTYLMDPSKLKGAITSRTKGIVPVHLYGQCADMDAIQEIADSNSLWVVEDACQAHLAEYKGKKAGTLGVAAAFSFYPGKNLGACGEAGAVTSNDADLVSRVKMIRDHGQSKKYYHEVEGYNGRCDALQAAALGVKLKYLQTWNEARRKNSALYGEYLKGIPSVKLPIISENCISSFHLYVVQVNDRDQVMERLKERGIAAGLHYPVPLHLQKAYAGLNFKKGDFPVTEEYTSKLLSLPMYPELQKEQIRYVCDALKEIVGK